MAEVEIRKGLVGVIADETKVSEVMPDINSLTYRGYAVQDLAETCIFEEVAYLLLNGELPNKSQLIKFQEEERNNREISTNLKKVIQDYPKNAHPMDTTRTSVSHLALENTTDKDREYFLRAVEQYEKGNDQFAINCMTDIVEWNPSQAEAWYYIGLIYSEWGKINCGNLFDEEELAYRQEAFNALDRAIAVSPSYADAYCLRGSIFTAWKITRKQ